MSSSDYFEFYLPSKDWGNAEATAARGNTITFADGSEALCGISGLWNASLGYGNQAVANAINDANINAATLPIFRRGSAYSREAAERLLDFALPHEYASVFYATSGSSALDAVVKLSRQFHAIAGNPKRRRIISFTGSYHGVTMGAMAVTGSYLFQDVYQVDQRLHIKIPYNDQAALDIVMKRFGPEIAAIIMEPVLGSGTLPVPAGIVESVYAYREAEGFLIAADEVATGFHRTGPRFASHHWTQPDVLVLSKALTNGTCAASALLLGHRVVDAFDDAQQVFWHGETQAGSPQSCAAIVATLDEIERLDIATSAARVGGKLADFVAGLENLSPRVKGFGSGSFRAVQLFDEDGELIGTEKVFELVGECRRRGAIVQPSPGALQFVPALNYPDAELDVLFSRIHSVVADYVGGRLA
ncbi:MAG: Aminotransferase [Pseudarthrobacter sp.]|nr:Aminotransferase [Pseudarthrobacter sp.]